MHKRKCVIEMEEEELPGLVDDSDSEDEEYVPPDEEKEDTDDEEEDSADDEEEDEEEDEDVEDLEWAMGREEEGESEKEDGGDTGDKEEEDLGEVDMVFDESVDVADASVEEDETLEVGDEEYDKLVAQYGDLLQELEDPTMHAMESQRKRDSTGIRKNHRAWDAFKLKTREDYEKVTAEDHQERTDYLYGRSSQHMMRYCLECAKCRFIIYTV